MKRVFIILVSTMLAVQDLNPAVFFAEDIDDRAIGQGTDFIRIDGGAFADIERRSGHSSRWCLEICVFSADIASLSLKVDGEPFIADTDDFNRCAASELADSGL